MSQDVSFYAIQIWNYKLTTSSACIHVATVFMETLDFFNGHTIFFSLIIAENFLGAPALNY